MRLFICLSNQLNCIEMEASLLQLDKLQAMINSEKDKYEAAIRNNHQFEDVKVIYLRIKELEQKAHDLMLQANSKVDNGNSILVLKPKKHL